MDVGEDDGEEVGDGFGEEDPAEGDGEGTGDESTGDDDDEEVERTLDPVVLS